uniref:Uncharacterized protein n=1 Tax=Oncorhynchus kisutch TaxID=8019 RepID=A0A8C7FNH2_ONCKI
YEGCFSPQDCSRGIHNREKLEGCFSPQGRSRGIHNREKPAEPIRPELKPRGDPCVIQAPKPLELIHRPSGDEPLARLQQKVFSSLKQVLEKLQLAESSLSLYLGREDVNIGTSCKNGGCSKPGHLLYLWGGGGGGGFTWLITLNFTSPEPVGESQR